MKYRYRIKCIHTIRYTMCKVLVSRCAKYVAKYVVKCCKILENLCDEIKKYLSYWYLVSFLFISLIPILYLSMQVNRQYSIGLATSLVSSLNYNLTYLTGCLSYSLFLSIFFCCFCTAWKSEYCTRCLCVMFSLLWTVLCQSPWCRSPASWMLHLYKYRHA